MIFLVLDERDDYVYKPDQPELLDRWMASILAGDGKNRWVDKSLNIVISKNGRFGGTEEHSIGDGAEFDHLMENIIYADYKYMSYPKEVVDIDKLENFRPKSGAKLAQRLKFNINDEMKSEINRCYSEYVPFKDDLDLASLMFRDFGKGHLKSSRIAPDGFFQMAIQLANYKDQGKFVLTYEAASARFYANSRTETLRTVSHDSCAFVKAMLDPTASDSERLRLLKKASETHQSRAKLAMTGKGVDRHLFV
ncbi:CPT-6 protein, partial [Aphelenchoides avenae]